MLQVRNRRLRQEKCFVREPEEDLTTDRLAVRLPGKIGLLGRCRGGVTGLSQAWAGQEQKGGSLEKQGAENR